jgi:hypothetical protein
MKKNIIISGVILIVLSILLINVRNVYAQVPSNYTSASYILSDPVFGEAGPYSQSTNFKEKNTIGQLVTGVSQSTNFILKSGFEYYSGQSVPSITMSINTNSINFGNILPGTIYKSPTNTIVTISSNSENGYNLYVNQNNNLQNQQGDSIPPVNNGATTSTAAPYTSTSYNGLGYSCSTSNSFEQAVLADTPVGFWSLGETSGTTAYDISGNNNNGTYQGGYTQGQSGPISNQNLGNSTYFKGSSSSGEVTGSLPQAQNTNTTITVWARYPSLTSHGEFVHIGLGNGYGIGIGNSTFGTVGNQVLVLFDETRWIPTGFYVSPGSWHFYTLVLNSSGYPTVYIDGRQIYTDSNGAPETPSPDFSIANDNGGYAGTTRFFQGELANVAVYNSALTQSQIQTIFNAGINNTSPFCNSDFINSNYYRQLSSTPTEFASYSSIANNQSINVNYAVNITNTQASGNYTNTITYTVSGNY